MQGGRVRQKRLQARADHLQCLFKPKMLWTEQLGHVPPDQLRALLFQLEQEGPQLVGRHVLITFCTFCKMLNSKKKIKKFFLLNIMLCISCIVTEHIHTRSGQWGLQHDPEGK